MAEYTEALDRIANVIEQFSREAAQSGPDPWLILLVGAVVGAISSLIVRYLVWDRQQKRLDEKKRILFAGLLGDEIEFRWRRRIGKDIKALFSNDYNITHARIFCKNMIISQKDLPIFMMVYNNLLELNVFVARYLLSHMIYVYILMNDLISAQNYIADLLQRYDQESDEELRRKIDSEIEHNWQNITEIIINEMFKHTDLIFSEIENDYSVIVSERTSRSKTM